MLLVLGGVLAGQPAVHELLRQTRTNAPSAHCELVPSP